eukprot:3865832-Amphidinium_carterae.1
MGLTGYENLSLDYKGPMVEEEYWNRMVALWKQRNTQRRAQAQAVADMIDKPLEIGEFSPVPLFKKVPEHFRVR